MKYVLALLAACAVSGAACAAPVQSSPPPAASCKRIIAAEKAIAAAEDFAIIIQVMEAVGFDPSTPETLMAQTGNNLETAKSNALGALHDMSGIICAKYEPKA
jgi:hypothetical protein